MEMIDIVDLMDLLEEVKRPMEPLSKTINFVCYKYDAEFSVVVKLHEASARKKTSKAGSLFTV